MNTQRLFLVLFLSLTFSHSVYAADLAAGEQKAAACASCHGQNGNSNNAQWPILAAQQSNYIVNQLKAFKAGERINPMMQSMAAGLTDSDINNLAAFFSSQKPVKNNSDSALAKLGEAKAAMCLGCHGSSGAGNGQFPRLAGQHPDYLVRQLMAFKTGSRKSGPMQAITSNFNESDFKELAAYFGSL